jgi:leucyl-tRNA synthetase
MKRYNPKEIEPRWQQRWAETKIYEAEDNSAKPKKYILEYFPYPSGAAMHVGHVRNYTIGDALSRYYRMRGFNVLHPMGWDAFGLPAENYAIKTGVSPQQAIQDNTARFKKQLTQMGFGYDWSREINSTDPHYYKWTQWLFLLLFKRGLAYQAESNQWWCPIDKTVLANEQVENGLCWRCGSRVEKKALKQWFFKITDYADRLEKDLDEVDWSHALKTMQRNWIGRKLGIDITYQITNTRRAMAASYVMGVDDITQDLKTLGATVAGKTESGHYKVLIPTEKLEAFEELIIRTMRPGFWNEYIAEQTVFIFKTKDNHIKRYVHTPDNEQEILALCNQYAQADFSSLGAMLLGNDFYRQQGLATITCFTTHPDTNYGATFIVVAPEHPLVQQIINKELVPKDGESQAQAVAAYKRQALAKGEVERQEEGRKKTGVFTGLYAKNTLTGRDMPIWVSDFVLMGFGTGAVVGVPAHDTRDFAFAKTFDIPIVEVVEPVTGTPQDNPEFRRSIVAIVRNPQTNEFLSINWGKQGGNLFIGGGREADEDIVEAAKREIAEETGYKDLKFVAQTGRIHHHYFAHSKGVARQIEVYGLLFDLASENREEPTPEADEQGQFSVEWLPKAEAESKITEELHALAYDLLVRGNCYTGEGMMVNSGPYNGMATAETREKISEDLVKAGVAEWRTSYRIRDWLISRQRYWGAPIPIIHCQKDGAVPVPDEQLPVVLPEMTSYEPSGDGRSPLARVPEFVNITCPKCGGPAQRETDTMDGFACSSWYFWRYLDPHNDRQAFSQEKLRYWAPVDDYIGGAEHAVMHLLYVRFWTKVMFDAGLVHCNEPIKALRNHGMILAPDGQKMSKSKGNTIEPDGLIEQGYGADAVRVMELFIGPWNQVANWSVEGMGGSFRFLQRVWNLGQHAATLSGEDQADTVVIKRLIHRTTKKVSEDLEHLSFNTAVAAMMEAVNGLYAAKTTTSFDQAPATWRWAIEILLQLLAPFAPHITDELWGQFGHDTSIHTSEWPVYDEQYLASDTMIIVVQINGKVRAQLQVPTDATEEHIIAQAKADEKVASYLNGKELKKSIYVPGKLVSFVM